MPIPAGDTSTLPDWAPTLDRVAAYTVARTLVPQADGSNLEVAAFSSTTRPTSDQVAQFVADACQWILTRTGAIDASLVGTASSLAARRAAAHVELRYPERQSQNRDDAVQVYDRLIKETDADLTALAAANEAVTGTDPEDPAALVMPVWSFPQAPQWGDYFP